MTDFIFDRKNYIAFYVVGYLLRGIIYHFIPVINDILLYGSLLWSFLIIGKDLSGGLKKPDTVQIPLLLFILFAFISSILNFNELPDGAWISLWNTVALFFIFFTAPSREDGRIYKKFFDRISLIAVLVVGVLAAGSLFLFGCYIAGINVPGGLASAEQLFTYGHVGEETRFCGLFGYSTDGGNLCSIGALLMIYLLEQKKLNRWIAGAGIVMFLYTIYLLDVRTSMIEMTVVGLLLVYRLMRKKLSAGKTCLILAVGLAVGVAAVVILKQNAINDLMARLREDPEGTLRFLSTGRTVYWKRAVEGFLKNPIFGTGWTNNSCVGYFDNHNLFFNLLLWTGLCGVGSILAFAVLFIRKLWRRRAVISEMHITSLIILLIAVLTASVFERTILGTANTTADTSFFWLSAGMLAYLNIRPAETENNRS